MQTLRRIGSDYAAQIAGFAVAMADRLLVPGLFLRALGVPAFSTWSVVVAGASLITALDFGVTRFYTNRLIAEVERGEDAAARASFAHGFALLLGISVVAGLALVGWTYAGGLGTGDAEADRLLPEVMVPVTAALAMRLAISLHVALFRAHRAFALETVLGSATDLVRIVVLVAALVAGLPLVAITWVWSVATVLLGLLLVWLSLRRHPHFSTGLALPGRAELAAMSKVAAGLWLSMAFNVGFMAIPTVLLGHLAASALAVAQFILLRTLANFARQMVNLFSNVFGLELARRHAAADDAGLVQVFGEASRLLATQIGLGCGILVVAGQDLFQLWTGKPELFSASMLAWAMGPMLLTANSLLAVEMLAYANRPWPIVHARVAQVALSIVLFAALPLAHAQERMMAALGLAEVLGLGFWLTLSLRRVHPELGLRFYVRNVAVACTTALLCAGLAWPARLLPLTGLGRAAVLVAAAGLAALLLFPIFGFAGARRRQLLGAARGLFRRAL